MSAWPQRASQSARAPPGTPAQTKTPASSPWQDTLSGARATTVVRHVGAENARMLTHRPYTRRAYCMAGGHVMSRIPPHISHVPASAPRDAEHATMGWPTALDREALRLARQLTPAQRHLIVRAGLPRWMRLATPWHIPRPVAKPRMLANLLRGRACSKRCRAIAAPTSSPRSARSSPASPCSTS
jgi:hypothetical protein